MTAQLIETSFEIPQLEELIKYQDKPVFTQVSHGLQARNQLTLWELFLRTGLKITDGPILDAGSGDALFLALAPHMIFSREEIGRRTVIAVDKDPKKVEKTRIVATLVTEDYFRRESKSITYVVLDPQDLATMDVDYFLINGRKDKAFPRVSMVWSNSMFHWIRESGDKYRALDNFNFLLRKGGVLCISMSAGGTARDFLVAYNNVFRNLGIYDRNYNPLGFRRAAFETDPVGSRPLDEVVNMIEDSGFDVVSAITLGETAMYHDPKHYARAVEVYGRDAYLNPVSHYSNKGKRGLWRQLETEFLNTLRKKGWVDGQPYTYTQYNNYIIAVKRVDNGTQRTPT
ncbi:class I SAM-dependent methyltransferase [Candidatus Woesearchaeota archaeon]|nr:class I SAM-dependent methyltransferase [Candidatus Woesearchaeota archaeon]